MTWRRADLGVGLLVAVVLVGGGVLSWQAALAQGSVRQMGSMMGMPSGVVHGPNPVWYLLGSLLVSAVVVGSYLVVRTDRVTSAPGDRTWNEPTNSATPDDTSRADEGFPPANPPEEHPRTRVLDLLPDDERRILEPVLSSPGITQVELRDRSSFSKSKVSQTVSGLERRGLLYRERQGRTYRIYPSEELRRNES